MTRNGQSNIRNEFNALKSVEIEVSHLHNTLTNNKIRFSKWTMAAIFDLAITQFVTGWQSSTSAVVHV